MKWVVLCVLVACRRTPDPPAPRPAEIDIVAVRAGASAPELETSVAQPLEEAVAKLPGLAHLHTRIAGGVVTIALELEPGTDRMTARADAVARVGAAQRALPPDVLPPIVRIGSAPPIARYIVRSPRMTASELRRWHEEVARIALERLPGVGELATCGGALDETAVVVAPERLAAFGAGLDAVISGVVGARSAELDRLRDAVIPGTRFRIGDLAVIEIRQRAPACQAYYERGRVLLGTIRPQVDADPVAVRAAVERGLAEVRTRAPAEVELELLPEHADAIEIPATGDEKAIAVMIRMLGQVRGIAHVVVETTAAGGTATVIPERAAPRIELRAGIAAATGVLADAGDPVVELRGPELGQLAKLAEQVRTGFARTAGPVLGAAEDSEQHLEIDREAAARLGVTAREAAQAFAALSEAGVMMGPSAPGGRPVVVRLGGTLTPLGDIRLSGAGGSWVPLSAVARIEVTRTPRELWREDRERAVALHVRATPAEIQRALDQLALPAGYRARVR